MSIDNYLGIITQKWWSNDGSWIVTQAMTMEDNLMMFMDSYDDAYTKWDDEHNQKNYGHLQLPHHNDGQWNHE